MKLTTSKEIKIDADATFLDLYKSILDCTGYSDKEMASFFSLIINGERSRKLLWLKWIPIQMKIHLQWMSVY